MFPSIDASPDISLRFGIRDLSLESHEISSPRLFRTMGEGDSEMQDAGSRCTGQGSTRDRNETGHGYDKTRKSQRSESNKRVNMGGGGGDDDGEHNNGDGDHENDEPRDKASKK
eukprot:3555711-Rhodomonas_salina.1